jgi:hypothetical protein
VPKEENTFKNNVETRIAILQKVKDTRWKKIDETTSSNAT